MIDKKQIYIISLIKSIEETRWVVNVLCLLTGEGNLVNLLLETALHNHKQSQLFWPHHPNYKVFSSRMQNRRSWIKTKELAYETQTKQKLMKNELNRKGPILSSNKVWNVNRKGLILSSNKLWNVESSGSPEDA